jgi:hypothetical protein
MRLFGYWAQMFKKSLNVENRAEMETKNEREQKALEDCNDSGIREKRNTSYGDSISRKGNTRSIKSSNEKCYTARDLCVDTGISTND